MKRLILTFVLCLFAMPAFAVCPATLQLKDNAGVTPTAKYADDGSGNCIPYIDIFGWGGGTLGAMANYGTSPGAVLVPGVNAFVTNTPPVTQSGTWTVQPGNTANTTPWLASISQGGNTAVVKAGNTAATTDVAAVVSDPNVLAAVQAAIPAGTNTIGNAGLVAPAGSTQETISATGTTGATTATLATAIGKTTYICGFSIRANATAAATGNATVTGTITGTLNFTQWTAPNASGLGVTEMVFTPCVPASATNTSIAVVSAAPGTGGVVSVTAWGFQL